MTLLLSVTVKIAVLTLAALAATALLRRRSAAVRHWVLATTVFACVCILPMELLLPEWPIPLPEGWSGSRVTSSLSFVNEPATSPVTTRSRGRCRKRFVRLATAPPRHRSRVHLVRRRRRWHRSPCRRSRPASKTGTRLDAGVLGAVAGCRGRSLPSLRCPPTGSRPVLPPSDLARHVGTDETDGPAAGWSAGLGRGSRACRTAARAGPRRARRLGRHPDRERSEGRELVQPAALAGIPPAETRERTRLRRSRALVRHQRFGVRGPSAGRRARVRATPPSLVPGYRHRPSLDARTEGPCHAQRARQP